MTRLLAPSSRSAAEEHALQIHAEFHADTTVPWLMCDRHPADWAAFRLVAEDLTEQAMTYGALRERSERGSGPEGVRNRARRPGGQPPGPGP
jgi:hypothetical protein